MSSGIIEDFLITVRRSDTFVLFCSVSFAWRAKPRQGQSCQATRGQKTRKTFVYAFIRFSFSVLMCLADLLRAILAAG